MAASFCKFRGVAALSCRFNVCADIFCLDNASVSHEDFLRPPAPSARTSAASDDE
ncbi:hypothetical protein K443DRAFT_8415 [Laccaria amethystina LaAM-08-1]|uniref:Uncharacterized protein n=1 Tax=Laccaria amethystina LaAM-08-1 TaxID=1095629 RepID=A0A0C9XD66_9AGAR|nr:hypothetical protein K443DRAFT_8415 [Laccaria amethystina LaAM-08-1]